MARKARSQADLIQFGTCQPHTMCSWPQLSDPLQPDTCQAHTMRSRPPWSDLSQAQVIFAMRLSNIHESMRTVVKKHSILAV